MSDLILDPSPAVRLVPRLMLAAEVEARIEQIWQAEQARLGDRLFDGPVHGLVSAGAGEIVLCPLRYRDVVARRRDPGLTAQGLGPPPVGVTGVLSSPDGIVFGRRSGRVAADPGLWEAAPSGVLSRPDPVAQLQEEMAEELGLGPGDHERPVARALMLGEASAEIVFSVVTALPAAAIQERWRAGGSDEYSEIRVVRKADIAAFLAEGGMLQGLGRILALAG